MSTPKVQVLGHFAKRYVVPFYFDEPTEEQKQEIIDAVNAAYDSKDSLFMSVSYYSPLNTYPAYVAKRSDGSFLVWSSVIQIQEGAWAGPLIFKIHVQTNGSISFTFNSAYDPVNHLESSNGNNNAATVGSVKLYVDQTAESIRSEIPSVHIVPFYTPAAGESSITSEKTNEILSAINAIKADTGDYCVFIKDGTRLIPAEYVYTVQAIFISAVSHDSSSHRYEIKVTSENVVTVSKDAFFAIDMSAPNATSSKAPTVSAVAAYVDKAIANLPVYKGEVETT